MKKRGVPLRPIAYHEATKVGGGGGGGLLGKEGGGRLFGISVSPSTRLCPDPTASKRFALVGNHDSSCPLPSPSPGGVLKDWRCDPVCLFLDWRSTDPSPVRGGEGG